MSELEKRTEVVAARIPESLEKAAVRLAESHNMTVSRLIETLLIKAIAYKTL